MEMRNNSGINEKSHHGHLSESLPRPAVIASDAKVRHFVKHYFPDTTPVARPL